MIKIAFFDVDGTILPFGHKEPNEKVGYALRKLRENGVLLCVATGRGYPLVPHFNNIDFDIYLTFNGSYTRNKSEVIRSLPLDKKDVHTVLENLRKMGKPASIANEKIYVANGSHPDLEQYFAFGNEKLVVSNQFDEIAEKPLYQIMCAAHKEEYDVILKGTENMTIASWWDRAMDIIPKDSGKGEAVKAVLDYYGFKEAEAIAFGDGGNDIAMLEAVGTGVAMGNAKEEVKKKADEICNSVDEDGVYWYCIEHKLI